LLFSIQYLLFSFQKKINSVDSSFYSSTWYKKITHCL
jgi:hypothetical protein